MKSILHATAILSSSSIISIGIGLVSAKALAVLLGPNGYGFMGLAQGLCGLTGLVAGMGIAAAIIREGASALAQGNFLRVAALRRASWFLLTLSGAILLSVLAIWRVYFSRWMLGGPEHANSVVFLGVAQFLVLAAGIETGVLNAYHRVKALAKVAVITNLMGSVATVFVVWQWGTDGIVAAIVVTSAVGFGVSYLVVYREIPSIAGKPTGADISKAAWSLFHFGGTYAAAMLVGSGITYGLPILVLHKLGTESVGYFRGATAVAGSYLGFMLTAMSQDYFPRVSAARHNAERLVDLVNAQQRVITLCAFPIILGALVFVPYLVPIVYSSRFIPTSDVLAWYLIGDLFKFSSWTMSYIILARCSRIVYFSTELVAGIATIGCSWLGIRWFGLAGLGIGYLTTYFVYYVVVWLIVRREIRFAWTAHNRWLMFAAVMVALIVRMLPLSPWAAYRNVVGLPVTIAAGFISMYTVYSELTRGKTGGINGDLVQKAES